MLPGEILALPNLDKAGYQNFLNWISAGAKHGSYAGMMPNEAVVRVENTPWGENVAYDAAGNAVSQYRAPRPGETSPYGGNVAPGSGGPSAPSAEQAAASMGQKIQELAPQLIQSLQATGLQAPAPETQQELPIVSQMRKIGINPDDLAEFIRRNAGLTSGFASI